MRNDRFKISTDGGTSPPPLRRNALVVEPDQRRGRDGDPVGVTGDFDLAATFDALQRRRGSRRSSHWIEDLIVPSATMSSKREFCLSLRVVHRRPVGFDRFSGIPAPRALLKIAVRTAVES